MAENYTVKPMQKAHAPEVKQSETTEPTISPLDREYAVITIENAEDPLTRVTRLERVHEFLCLECGFNGLEPASKQFSKYFHADNLHELRPGQKAWIEKGMALHAKEGHDKKFLHITVELKKARDLNADWRHAENPNPAASEPKLFPKVWTN